MKHHNIPKSPIDGVTYGNEIFWDETDERFGSRNSDMNRETEEYIQKALDAMKDPNSPIQGHCIRICPECDGWVRNEPFHTRYDGYILVGCEGYHIYRDYI